MNEQTHIIDDGDLRKYRIELPNLVDDLDLSPFAFRLYAHFKRVCGASPAGHCWQGTRELAAACHMSTGKISDAKKELEAAGLIEIGVRATPTGPGDDITIVDIWRRNVEAFSGGGSASVHHMNASTSVQDMNTGAASVHHMNDSVHHMNERINQLRNQPASQPRARARTTTASQDAPTTDPDQSADELILGEPSHTAIVPPAAAPLESVSLETVPPAPPNEAALTHGVLDMWQRYVEDVPSKVRRAKLAGLAGIHGAYWVARCIDHAADCDGSLDADPDRALNYVSSILKRWQRDGTYGADHPDYTAKHHAKEQRDERNTRSQRSERGYATPRNHRRTYEIEGTDGAGAATNPDVRARHLPIRRKVPPPTAT